MTTTITDPATPAQKRFLNSLRVQRGYAPIHDDDFSDKRATSRAIDEMKRLPITAPTARVAPTNNGGAFDGLPLCKYIVTGDAGQKVHVEVVERRGGRRYVNVLIGAPGDWHRQNVSYATMISLAAKIRCAEYTDRVEVGGELIVRDLVGAEAAAVRFSREHKCCSACLSPLSDESQPGYAVGLGPVCRTRFGY